MLLRKLPLLQKSGGLADVAGSLPKALVKDGVDARVIMPLYGDLKMRDKLRSMSPTTRFPWAGAASTAACSRPMCNGVTYYFLDNEYYFKRRGLYGFTTMTASASPSSPARC